ncbi:membrane protein [Parapedobacter pyrenivorans]|uniref:Membrane protein n=1 Tax=Parapedobacter pyrenivorans TaxID=1305674 RepID=A0A917HWL8_9SPHI|nr:EamA/RhaT family transporter [Parapedobacter pyrenivorans]GGG90999.1 membrane protein [Parapedobacter pyrenivorans]
MVYVLFSVFCSVSVSVILKLARRYAVDVPQIIVWNYPVAVLCTWLFLQPDWSFAAISTAPVALYGTLALLLPGIFFALGASIRYAGIVRTEVAQRLSLFIALLAAFWLFGETAHTGKLIGIVVGIVGILCSIGWHKGKNQHGLNHGMWLFPMLVFFGYGIIDILFKLVAQHTEVPYTASMLFVFCGATVAAFAYLGYQVFISRKRFSMHAVFWGIVLGGFNFANILFYMKAHRALPENPSMVFTGMNVGVIALGALIGIFVFNEKVSFVNKIGVILAIVSVLIIAYS